MLNSLSIFYLQTYPFIFALMSHKNTECYEALFRFIEERIAPLNPKSIMTDYEGSMRKAIRSVYPAAKLNGCWFHFCQAVRRKARSFKEKLIEKIIKKKAMPIYMRLLCLPLLPKDKIMDGFKALTAQAMKDGSFKLMESLFEYFQNFWLKPVSYIYFSIAYDFHLDFL